MDKTNKSSKCIGITPSGIFLYFTIFNMKINKLKRKMTDRKSITFPLPLLENPLELYYTET